MASPVQPPIITPAAPVPLVTEPDPLESLLAISNQGAPSSGASEPPLDAGTEALAQVQLLTEHQALKAAYPDLQDSEVFEMQRAEKIGDTHKFHSMVRRGVERQLERESQERKTTVDNFQVESPGGGPSGPSPKLETRNQRRTAALAEIKGGKL